MGYAGSTQDERVTVGATAQRNGILGVQAETASGVNTYYERDPGGTLTSARTPGGDFYYYFDGLGSVLGLVDPAGNQRAAYTYDPYGANATATGINGALPANPWRYASGYQDPTGLYHFGARYYDPTLGRWTQQDSIVELGNPGNGNRYAYVGGDPINRVDPSGRDYQVPLPSPGDVLDAFVDQIGSIDDSPAGCATASLGIGIAGGVGIAFSPLTGGASVVAGVAATDFAAGVGAACLYNSTGSTT